MLATLRKREFQGTARVGHSQLDADAQNCLMNSSYKNSVKDEFRRRLSNEVLDFFYGERLAGSYINNQVLIEDSKVRSSNCSKNGNTAARQCAEG